MLPSQIKHDVYGGGVGKILVRDSGPHSPLIKVPLLEGEVTWDYQGQISWASKLLGTMAAVFPQAMQNL